MMIRLVFIGVAALAFSAESVQAQSPAPKQPVISEAALKSMAARKPKAKTPMAARVGMVRRTTVVARDVQAPQTSVREITPPSKKK